MLGYLLVENYNVETGSLNVGNHTIHINFNTNHIQTIQNMGFGAVLKRKIDSIPTMLGYLLVENYNVETNSLNLGNYTIHITAELMHSLTVIPNRNVTMTAKRSSNNGTVVAEWRGQFIGTAWIKRLGVKVYFDDILPTMDDYGKNFRLDFLVAIFTIIEHASDNVVVNQQFLHNVKPNIEINQMKWCDYLIECLQQAKSAWTLTKHFTGPLIVLAV
ncbi:hypothetical protein Hanom_Chr14g01262171 [Helianthus anomalus]